MIKKIVIRNGKKYIVNSPSWDDGAGDGYDYGIGSGGPLGTLWMSLSGSWYTMNASGSSGSVTTFINQTTTSYKDNSSGYQLLSADNGNSYFVYLTGTSNNAIFTISQSAYTGSANPKPNLLLQSTTNGNFYTITLHNSASVITPLVNQNYISSSQIRY